MDGPRLLKGSVSKVVLVACGEQWTLQQRIANSVKILQVVPLMYISDFYSPAVTEVVPVDICVYNSIIK